MPPAPVTIHHLELLEIPDEDTAVFVAECSKGTYVRSLARDIGLHLGTRGHVVALRRLISGPFTEEMLISLDDLEQLSHSAPGETGQKSGLATALLSVETALDDIPALAIKQECRSKITPRTIGFAARTGGSDRRLCRGHECRTAGGHMRGDRRRTLA